MTVKQQHVRASFINHLTTSFFLEIAMYSRIHSFNFNSSALSFGNYRGTPRADRIARTLYCEIGKKKRMLKNFWTPEGYVCCKRLYRVFFQTKRHVATGGCRARRQKYCLLKPKVYRCHHLTLQLLLFCFMGKKITV